MTEHYVDPDEIQRHIAGEGGLMSYESEMAVLGAALTAPGACDEIFEILKAGHFGDPVLGRIYGAAHGLVKGGRGCAPALIRDALGDDPGFSAWGGIDRLQDLVETGTLVGANDHAAAVIDRAARRAIRQLTQDVAGRVNDTRSTDAVGLIEQLEKGLAKITEGTGERGGFATFSAALDDAMGMAEDAYARKGGLAGVSTGLIDLDQKTGGLAPTDLIILAGRPSMGKSALCLNMAYSLARAYAFERTPDGGRKTVRGGVVGFFSLEMSKGQLAMRLLADVSGIPSDRLRRGDFDDNEYARLRDARDEINGLPLHIDETGGIPLAKLVSRARRLHRKVGLDLIVIDYLQLITAEGKGENRVVEISRITIALKALAKELGVPVLALSQLSRTLESRTDKRPQLSDLRESGSIEQDADVVMFIYREAYYLARTEPAAGDPGHLDWSEKMDRVASLAEVIIGKQRHGPIGTVRLHFNEDLTKFSNLARQERIDFAAGPKTYVRPATPVYVQHAGDSE